MMWWLCGGGRAVAVWYGNGMVWSGVLYCGDGVGQGVWGKE